MNILLAVLLTLGYCMVIAAFVATVISEIIFYRKMRKIEKEIEELKK